MPDLEKEIAAWRCQLRNSGLRADEVLAELENHLREDVERQIAAGTPLEQAFAAAAERIGHPAALRAEFSKLVQMTGARLMKRIALSVGLFLAYMIVLGFICPALAKAGMNSGPLKALIIASIAVAAVASYFIGRKFGVARS